MLSFAFAKSFPAVVVSRVIAGALNGNLGVAKTIVSSSTHLGMRAEAHDAKIAEISTESNRARLFNLLLIAMVTGTTVGEHI